MQYTTPQMLIPSFPNANITGDQIQKYLDENKQLILAILDNQNLGKLAECAQYQAKLQHNLMYLAAIADAQPQAPAIPSQNPPPAMMQQAGHYMQHPQMTAGQPSPFPQKMSPYFNPQQMQDQHQLRQHPQSIQGHLGMRSGSTNGMNLPMHSENVISSSGGPPAAAGLSEFMRSVVSGGSMDGRSNKQDARTGLEAGSANVHGTSVARHRANDADPSLDR